MNEKLNLDSISENLVTKLYTSFQALDGDAMASCYSDAAFFSDPVFPNLEKARVRNMWKMLCHNSSDLKVTFEVVESDEAHALVDWHAHYTFSRTGRRVHNKVRARFKVLDGKIVEHIDSFDFWCWSRQALGLAGVLLGWTSGLQRKVQKSAADSLQKFESSR